jgi:hypothetical protein
MALTARIRGQARSYNGFGSDANSAFDTTSVGAGLLANAVGQAMTKALTNRGGQAIPMALTARIRGQARSYSGFGSSPNFAFAATSVGAGLLANAVGQAMTKALTNRGVRQLRWRSQHVFAGKRAPAMSKVSAQSRV